MIKQSDTKTAVQATGVGLPLPQKVTLTLRPAPANAVSSIVPTLNPPADFRPMPNLCVIPCLVLRLVNEHDVRISTVEHLNAAHGLRCTITSLLRLMPRKPDHGMAVPLRLSTCCLMPVLMN